MKHQGVVSLTSIQQEWLIQAAKRWADQSGQSISKETVILKLMELGLPLFEERILKGTPTKKKATGLRLIK